jgi:hypothetical protein
MSWYDIIKYASWRNKLTILSRSISDNIFRQIMADNKVSEITISQSEFPDLRNYNMKYIFVKIINSDKNYIAIPGDYDDVFQAIRINLMINRNNFSQQSYEELRGKLRQAIRHEIEHPHMLIVNPEIPSSVSLADEEIDKSNIIEIVNRNMRYLLNEGEINAYIRDLMEKAKYENVLIDDFLDRFITESLVENSGFQVEYIEREMGQQTAIGIQISNVFQTIKDAYLSKINQIYPNRRKGRYDRR